MTYQEFKSKLYRIKKNRDIIRLLKKKLETYPEDMISTAFSGAIDYSKDRVQKTSDIDGALINVLQKIDDDIKHTIENITKLEEENEDIEKLLFKAETEDIAGSIVRAYFIDGIPMQRLAILTNYSSKHCYKLWNWKIQELYERYQNERGC